MADEAPGTNTTPPGEAGAPAGDAAAAPPPQTLEEVEAAFRFRQSQNDRAHAAEVQELKRQLEAATQAPPPPPEGESPEAQRVRELETALAAERSARAVAELSSQYPLTARTLGEGIANFPRERLAANEAALEAANEGPAPRMDPNAAARGGLNAAQAKPVNEKSKDELLADLQRLAPAYQQALREGVLD